MIKTFVSEADGALISGHVCGREGKWIKLVRCGTCDSDGDKGKVGCWVQWAYDEESSVTD